jgi:uncharacterized protein
MYFYLYKDASSQWRWTLYSNNTLKVANSGESYWNKSDCLHAIDLVRGTNSYTPVKE